jgi:hypothetical protein
MTNEPGTSVTLIKRIYDEKLHYGQHEDFYFLEKYDPKDPAEVEMFNRTG